MLELLHYFLQTGNQISIQDYPIVSKPMEIAVCAGLGLFIGCAIYLVIVKKRVKNSLKKHNPNRDNK